MKFQTPLLILLTSLLSYVSADATGTTDLDARQHARDFAAVVPDIDVRDSDFSKRAAPAVPHGKDATKLHVWIRTDTRPTTYDDRSGASHEGLNQLIKDTGGKHKDVVIGNSKGHWEYGLQFDSRDWTKKPNGDGAKVSSYGGDYVEVPNGHETFEYKGQVKDGRRTFKSIDTIAENEIKGKTYNHRTYNCKTFADHLANILV
ncbi:hypothetical protein F4802DRAFT_597836 [Xylaria palmicola]|nr:hypothetical protein F4802DRAFT_597836 [Xylaria palmicola]